MNLPVLTLAAGRGGLRVFATGVEESSASWRCEPSESESMYRRARLTGRCCLQAERAT